MLRPAAERIVSRGTVGLAELSNSCLPESSPVIDFGPDFGRTQQSLPDLRRRVASGSGRGLAREGPHIHASACDSWSRSKSQSAARVGTPFTRNRQSPSLGAASVPATFRKDALVEQPKRFGPCRLARPARLKAGQDRRNAFPGLCVQLGRSVVGRAQPRLLLSGLAHARRIRGFAETRRFGGEFK